MRGALFFVHGFMARVSVCISYSRSYALCRSRLRDVVCYVVFFTGTMYIQYAFTLPCAVEMEYRNAGMMVSGKGFSTPRLSPAAHLCLFLAGLIE